MSSLWTPSGEHPVPRGPTNGPGGGDEGGSSSRPGPSAGGSATATAVQQDRAEARGRPAGPGQRELTPDELREAEAEMDAVREQLLRAPVELVISNHAMGLWELAALHLSQKPPRLAQAQLAIDALSALVDGMRGRLGEAERTLVDGLAEMRMAFVQIANAEKGRQATGQGV